MMRKVTGEDDGRRAVVAKWLQLRRPFEAYLPTWSGWGKRLMLERDGWARTLAQSMLALPLSFGCSMLSLVLGGGSSSLYWLTNGVIILYLNVDRSVLGFALSLILSTAGLGFSFQAESLFPSTELVALHASVYGLENLVASLAMRTLLNTCCVIETIKTMRFLIVVIVVTGPLASGLGATLGTVLLVESGQSDDFLSSWTEYFVGNFTGNFIVVYLGYLVIAHSNRRHYGELRKLLRTRSGVLYSAAFFGFAAVIAAVFSLEGLATTQAIPFILVVLPILGSLSLVMSQIAMAAMNVVLVVSVVMGTTSKRGPLYVLVRDDEERDLNLCIQVTLLLSTLITAALGVVREQRIAAAIKSISASDEKLTFFTHVSHEFRTPLSVVIGYTEDLLEHHDLSSPVRVDMENILYASLGMSAMVEDLLALFRLETHGLVFSARRIQTQEFFDKVLSVAARLARTKGHRVSMEVDLPPTLIFDPNRMNQMLVNLLSNAVKFTPAGGAIEIEGRLATPEEEEAANKDKSVNKNNITISESTNVVDGGGRGGAAGGGDGGLPFFSRGNRGNSGKHNFSSGVHGNFNRHNDFKNGLVVDLDGSNGLLARLGRRRGSYLNRARTLGGSDRGNPFSRDVPPPAPAPAPRTTGMAGVSYPVDRSQSTPLMVISVMDSGPGIPPEDVARLFERFFRADKTGAEGTGLGLTICQHIATSMGGNIKVSSTLGVGSTFAVTVPVIEVLSIVAAPADASHNADEATVNAIGNSSEASLQPVPGDSNSVEDEATPKIHKRRGSRSPVSREAATPPSPPSSVYPVPPRGARGGEPLLPSPSLLPGSTLLTNGERCKGRSEAWAQALAPCDIATTTAGEDLRAAPETSFTGRPGCHHSLDVQRGCSKGGVHAAVINGSSKKEASRDGGERGKEEFTVGLGSVAEESIVSTGDFVDTAGEKMRGGPKRNVWVAESAEEPIAVSMRLDADMSVNWGKVEEGSGTPTAAHSTVTTGAPQSPAGSTMASDATVRGYVRVMEGKNAGGTMIPKQRVLCDLNLQEQEEQDEPLRLKILLAEDSLPNQKLMCRILQRAGHAVEAVGDGQAALDYLASGRFDLLVLDLGMPKKKGLEVLTELRAMPPESSIRDIPVIVSSGHVLDEHRRLCLEAGCNAFTEKPFRAKFIVETVQRVMREHVAATGKGARW